jgi:hypothetical protein
MYASTGVDLVTISHEIRTFDDASRHARAHAVVTHIMRRSCNAITKEGHHGTQSQSAAGANREGIMRQLTYAMRFTGQAIPANDDGTALTAATTSPSTTITSTVGDTGLTTTIEPAQGDTATFTSQVAFSSASAFTESGTITFGEGNRLTFSTVGEGYLGPAADASLQHGTVMWRVDGGEGQFAGASGLITSNFFVDGNGAVTDHQFGMIFVR